MSRSNRSRNRKRNQDRDSYNNNGNRRDTVRIANANALPVSVQRMNTLVDLSDFRLFEDRRTWHPAGPLRPIRSLKGFSRVTNVPIFRQFKNVNNNLNNFKSLKTVKNKFYVTQKYNSLSTMGFSDPRTLVCVRRQMRKQVLFAKRKTGRRGQKKPRFNMFSKISCRR